MTDKRETFSALVPFQGFYYSIHHDNIEEAEQQMFCDSNGSYSYDNLHDLFYQHVNYRDVRERYAREYVACMRDLLELPSLQFEEVVSPRFYNFTTDRIFAAISRADLAKVLRAVRGKRLNEQIHEMFTSRPGFCSFYPNDLATWPRVADWDHNHVGAALAAYIKLLDPKDRFAESISSDLIGGCDIEDWLYGAADHVGQAAADLASIKRRLEEDASPLLNPCP